jgi:hypothetical protein
MGLGQFKRGFLNMRPDPAGEGWAVFEQSKWAAARE